MQCKGKSALEERLEQGRGKTYVVIRAQEASKESVMKWTKPKVKEVCVALEINDYFPAEYQV